MPFYNFEDVHHFSRIAEANTVDDTGRFSIVPADNPRIIHSTVGKKRGIFVETENIVLLLTDTDISAGGWTPQNCTVDAQSISTPLGVASSTDRILRTATGSQTTGVTYSLGGGSGQATTFSVGIKEGTHGIVEIGDRVARNAYVVYDVTNGTILEKSQEVHADIVPDGFGGYLCRGMFATSITGSTNLESFDIYLAYPDGGGYTSTPTGGTGTGAGDSVYVYSVRTTAFSSDNQSYPLYKKRVANATTDPDSYRSGGDSLFVADIQSGLSVFTDMFRTEEGTFYCFFDEIHSGIDMSLFPDTTSSEELSIVRPPLIAFVDSSDAASPVDEASMHFDWSTKEGKFCLRIATSTQREMFVYFDGVPFIPKPRLAISYKGNYIRITIDEYTLTPIYVPNLYGSLLSRLNMIVFGETNQSTAIPVPNNNTVSSAAESVIIKRLYYFPRAFDGTELNIITTSD